MGALLYLTKRSLINNLKKALKKPLTLLLIVVGIAYSVFVMFGLGLAVQDLHIDSTKGLIVVITAWTLYTFLMNFIGYTGRRGIIFRPAHAHFVFPAPVSPKVVLIHGAWMNYLTSIIANLIFTIGALTVFDVAPWRAVLYFVLGTALELAFEISTIIILYTNERLSEKGIQRVCMLLKILLFAVTAAIALYFYFNGLTVENVFTFVDLPQLLLIPGVGWCISFLRLILIGAEGVNLLGGILYLVMVTLTVLIAFRMKCEGSYYEDAAKFADDYVQIKQRSKSGEVVWSTKNKKKKYKAVSGEIKATGAKAIFYRQMLEYKKERFFVLDGMTGLELFLGVVVAKSFEPIVLDIDVPQFVLLGTVVYMTFIMTAYLGKWEKELKNPYLYLIPDTPVRKLLYATLFEHLKALADGAALCLPFYILWDIRLTDMIFCILIFAVLQANKLYTKIIAQCLVGDHLGKIGQDVVRFFIQSLLLGFGILAVILAGILGSVNLVMPIALIYSVVVTAFAALLASIRFEKMEQLA